MMNSLTPPPPKGGWGGSLLNSYGPPIYEGIGKIGPEIEHLVFNTYGVPQSTHKFLSVQSLGRNMGAGPGATQWKIVDLSFKQWPLSASFVCDQLGKSESQVYKTLRGCEDYGLLDSVEYGGVTYWFPPTFKIPFEFPCGEFHQDMMGALACCWNDPVVLCPHCRHEYPTNELALECYL